MEFIEYYQIIRSRIWLAIMMAAAAFVVVTVYQVLPTSSWPAEGQMSASQEAAWDLQWSGNNVNMIEDREFWGTLEQFVTSRGIRDMTVSGTGVTNPDDWERTRTFEFERGKRGQYFVVRGWGPSSDAAHQYVTLGMKTIAEQWNAGRRARYAIAVTELKKSARAQQERVQALQDQIDGTQTGSSTGRPTERLTWVQGQINVLGGNISDARVEIGIAQDRVTSLNSLARREESLPPDQRLLAPTATGPAAALQAQLVQAELGRSRMLLTRTPGHPQVVALDRELEDLRQRIGQMQKANGNVQQAGSGLPSALREQITMAGLDLRAAQRRADAHMAEEAQLRAQVPALLNQSRRYQELESELKLASDEAARITSGVQTTQAEIARLDATDDLQPLGEAVNLPSPKTLPKYALMAVVASFAGFVMGCMLIFALHHIDLTFKNESEAEHLLGYPVIAGIPRTDITLVPLPPPGGDSSQNVSSEIASGSDGIGESNASQQ
jgi:uncharacterized protein involved in exopolysaccharide biosynthesis